MVYDVSKLSSQAIQFWDDMLGRYDKANMSGNRDYIINVPEQYDIIPHINGGGTVISGKILNDGNMACFLSKFGYIHMLRPIQVDLDQYQEAIAKLYDIIVNKEVHPMFRKIDAALINPEFHSYWMKMKALAYHTEYSHEIYRQCVPEVFELSNPSMELILYSGYNAPNVISDGYILFNSKFGPCTVKSKTPTDANEYRKKLDALYDALPDVEVTTTTESASDDNTAGYDDTGRSDKIIRIVDIIYGDARVINHYKKEPDDLEEYLNFLKAATLLLAVSTDETIDTLCSVIRVMAPRCIEIPRLHGTQTAFVKPRMVDIAKVEDIADGDRLEK